MSALMVWSLPRTDPLISVGALEYMRNIFSGQPKLLPVRLHVFGDSHASACFDRFTDANIYWLGPLTMHRVGRDGADFVLKYVPISEPDDLFVFVFGEIDVRCHIIRIAEKKGRTPEMVVNDLVDRFINSIEEVMKGRSGRVVICSVVPPSTFSGDPNYPTCGTLRDRVAIQTMLNEKLRSSAGKSKFLYLDFARFYVDRKGGLCIGRSDGAVHIGLDHTKPIRDELARLIGEPIRYRWDLWWRSRLHRPLEWALSKVRPGAMWRFNRSHVNVRTRPRS